MSDEELARLEREGHGAIQVEEAITVPLRVFIGGPIKHWWTIPQDDWDTHPVAAPYFEWRGAVETACVKEGFLCYMPHKSLRGAWHDSAQLINDFVIATFDVMLDLTPVGVPATGTQAEVHTAMISGKPVISAPPGTIDDLKQLLSMLHELKEIR